MSEQTHIEPLNPAQLVALLDRLQQRVAELERQNAELRAENERLRRRQQRQAAPFSKETPVPSPKRPGRKAGQGRFLYRPAPLLAALSEAPIAVAVTECVCPHCGGALIEAGAEVASLTDLPPQSQPLVRQFQVTVCRCRSCGRRVRGRHPDLAADQYGATAHRLGPRVLAAAHSLHYQQGVPVRRVPAILAELTGVHVTQSALTQDALRQAAGPVGSAYQALRASMGQAQRVHADDTGWRVGGKPAQLMGFTTETATVYQIRDRHRNQEVREVIPADFAGVLCTDRGRSYDAQGLAQVKQQKRVAHLQARVLPDPDNQRLLEQLGWHHHRGNLLRFLEDPRIEPTKNRAERALRPAVIARKVSQCSKT